MWILFMAFMFLGGIAAIIYLVTRFHNFLFVKKMVNRKLSWLVASVPVALIACFAFYDIFAMIVIMLHLALFFILSDLTAHIYRKVKKKEKGEKYWSGLAAVIITVVFMTCAWFCAYHVFRTHYEFDTDKNVGDIRVIVIADSHLGITLDGKRFGEQMERIDREGADCLIIDGDFVDDDSSKEDLVEACKALGRMKTPVYYIYGNHDRGYYNYRDFTADDLVENLTANGVVILQDEVETVNGKFYLVGREDRSRQDRKSVQELLEPLDKNLYIVTADHQPGDFDDEALYGADLVLSGHTHGGHVWPSGYFAYWFGVNDGIWGLYERGNTHCIVTSGISGWAIPFKTGTFSEYVIIDIHGK